MLIAFTLAAGVMGVIAGAMRRHEAPLDTRGRRVVGVVEDVNDRGRYLPDTVVVGYEVEGRRYEAEIPVGQPSDFEVGMRTEVIYDVENPSHAKVVEGWSPAYSSQETLTVLVLAVGVVHSTWRSVTTVVALRDLRRGVAPLDVRLEGFSSRRWWQRWTRPWAGLWPLSADPTAGRAQLHLPVETATGLRVEEPSVVLGPPSPGRWLVVVQGDRVIWPRGPARRDPPRRSQIQGRVEHVDNPWGT